MRRNNGHLQLILAPLSEGRGELLQQRAPRSHRCVLVEEFVHVRQDATAHRGTPRHLWPGHAHWGNHYVSRQRRGRELSDTDERRHTTRLATHNHFKQPLNPPELLFDGEI